MSYPPNELSPIGPFISLQDGSNLDAMLGMIKRKNETVPTDALAVPAMPVSSHKGLHISTKRVVLHVVQALEEKSFLINGELFELFGGLL